MILERVTIITYIIWNILVFFIYALDKYKAKKGSFRISENTLILLSTIMGSFGAIMAMKIFRHKTKHIKFAVAIPLGMLLNITIIAVILYWKVI